MYCTARFLLLEETLTCAFFVALVGCDSVVSLDPVIGDADAVQAPEILGDWTSNDTVIYRVTADTSNPTAYVVRITGPAIADEPDLADIVIALRATRIQQRLLIEITPSEADSLIGRVMRSYGSLLQTGYLHAVIVAATDSLRAFPFGVPGVRDALASGACPAASGRALLRSGGAASRDVVLGGVPSELRSIVTCFLDRPGVLTESEILHRPRPPIPPREPGEMIATSHAAGSPLDLAATFVRAVQDVAGSSRQRWRTATTGLR